MIQYAWHVTRYVTRYTWRHVPPHESDSFSVAPRYTVSLVSGYCKKSVTGPWNREIVLDCDLRGWWEARVIRVIIGVIIVISGRNLGTWNLIRIPYHRFWDSKPGVWGVYNLTAIGNFRISEAEQPPKSACKRRAAPWSTKNIRFTHTLDTRVCEIVLM